MLHKTVAGILLPISLNLLANAAVVSQDLHIVNQEISPDGFTRDAVLAEGIFPGPLITGNKGDNFQLNVINELTDNNDMLLSTSIHWHGFFQHTTNWADGPAFINQCPIATNHSFLYNFNVPDQAGTFWYHSHLGVQYCDGLRGAFIVYDPDDPYLDMYDVDDASTVITLADWYHIPSGQEGPFPIADAVLVNGLGQYIDGPDSPLSVINVVQGKRYRFRLANIACLPSYLFLIDGHNMTVIEADGVNTEPYEVDTIVIFAAQRYSFILTANQPVDNYWIRSLPDLLSLETPSTDLGLNAAILRYQGAPVENPTTVLPSVSVSPLMEQNLFALDPGSGVPGGAGPGEVDVALNFAVDFDLLTLMFQVNGVTFTPPTVPVLLQILSGAQTAQDLLPAGSVYVLPANSVIELSIPGGALGGGHPVHLHGHTFYVVRSAGSSTYNYVNPVQRDVVNIGTFTDNVTIRWVTNNPGPWFFHCHIDWHLNEGFAVAFAEDTPDVAATNPVPTAWSDLCPIYDALPPDQL